MLRMLIPLAGHHELVGPRTFVDDAVARVLGLDEWIDPEDREFDPAILNAYADLAALAAGLAASCSARLCLS